MDRPAVSWMPNKPGTQPGSVIRRTFGPSTPSRTRLDVSFNVGYLSSACRMRAGNQETGMANTEDRLTPRQRNNLRFYFAVVFGVILGAVLGPLVFTPLGMKVPVASVTG